MRAKHCILLLLLGGLTSCNSIGADENVHPCDTNNDGFYMVADLNGEKWCGQPRTVLFFTGNTFYPLADSLFSLQAYSTLPNGFITGVLSSQMPFCGTGVYDITFTPNGRTGGPSGPDTLHTYAAFRDEHHDVGLAKLGVKRDEYFRLIVESYNLQTNLINGSFAGTFTYQGGIRATNSLRNYQTDTLRFKNGHFVTRLQAEQRYVE